MWRAVFTIKFFKTKLLSNLQKKHLTWEEFLLIKFIQMKYFSTISFLLITNLLHSQSLLNLQPVLGKVIDKSHSGEIEHQQMAKECKEIENSLSQGLSFDQLSDIQKELYTNCDEIVYLDYWDVLGNACSWYCGGGPDTVSASSHLSTYKNINYNPKNAHDLSYKTAWVEGVTGDGIGEYLTYHFLPESPRITKIIIVNGYVKSPKAWKNNSRVKTLKLYWNEKPFAILNLQDSKAEQIFNFEPIGYNERDDWKQLSKMPPWTLKFEILEVYKGDKYDDTAITEIYFDGIDVH